MSEESLTQKKTLKLKSSKPKPELKAGGGETPAAEPGLAAPVRAAMPLAHASIGAAQRSYTFDAMAALVIFLMLAALLLFQWLEYSFYDQPPIAFPLKMPGMPSGGM